MKTYHIPHTHKCIHCRAIWDCKRRYSDMATAEKCSTEGGKHGDSLCKACLNRVDEILRRMSKLGNKRKK